MTSALPLSHITVIAHLLTVLASPLQNVGFYFGHWPLVLQCLAKDRSPGVL